jgi:hypothetical protein
MRFIQTSLVALVVSVASAQAAVIVNPAATLDRELTVQLIQARTTGGTNPATVFGNAAQRLEIETTLDQIWAQAGIDITLLPTVTFFDNSFALNNNGNTAGIRPTGDLSTIFVQAGAAGVLLPGKVAHTVFVDFVPGFPLLTENSSAGLAFVGGNGIAMFVGDNLVGFPEGLELIAGVFAHEIGHNLGLNHVANSSPNLMAGGDATTAQLDLGQIATARSSNLLVAVPEPASLSLLLPGLLLVTSRRRRM